jgi:hypothetical protein
MSALVRLRARNNREVKVLFREKHWLSVAESNCVTKRWGGEQLEANNQSVIRKMNSIRLYALASLRAYGEAGDRKLTREGRGNSDNLYCGKTVSAVITGMHRVVGDRMVGSYSDVNQGSLSGERKEFMIGVPGPKSLPEGDRASVVVKKRGNVRGAKGGRLVEA